MHLESPRRGEGFLLGGVAMVFSPIARALPTASVRTLKRIAAVSSDGDVHLGWNQPSWDLYGKVAFTILVVHIMHIATFFTEKMTMVLEVGAITGGRPFHIDLLDKATFYQCVQGIVDRGHRNLRHVCLDPQIDIICRWMICLVQQRLVDMLALSRHSQTAVGQ